MKSTMATGTNIYRSLAPKLLSVAGSSLGPQKTYVVNTVVLKLGKWPWFIGVNIELSYESY